VKRNSQNDSNLRIKNRNNESLLSINKKFDKFNNSKIPKKKSETEM